MNKKKPALFLDRDGTINIDHVYINDPHLIELLPGVGEAIRKAQNAGFKIIVVTNQSGVGRGIIDPKVLPLIHGRLDELLTEKSASIDSYKSCIHTPEENCSCRKPSPQLVFEATQELNIDLTRSYFIGDKLSDVATGKASGCFKNILVRTGKGEEEERVYILANPKNPNEKPDYVATDLSAAVDWILVSSLPQNFQ